MTAATIAALFTGAAALITAVGAAVHASHTRSDLADHLFNEHPETGDANVTPGK